MHAPSCPLCRQRCCLLPPLVAVPPTHPLAQAGVRPQPLPLPGSHAHGPSGCWWRGQPAGCTWEAARSQHLDPHMTHCHVTRIAGRAAYQFSSRGSVSRGVKASTDFPLAGGSNVGLACVGLVITRRTCQGRQKSTSAHAAVRRKAGRAHCMQCAHTLHLAISCSMISSSPSISRLARAAATAHKWRGVGCACSSAHPDSLQTHGPISKKPKAPTMCSGQDAKEGRRLLCLCLAQPCTCERLSSLAVRKVTQLCARRVSLALGHGLQSDWQGT